MFFQNKNRPSLQVSHCLQAGFMSSNATDWGPGCVPVPQTPPAPPGAAPFSRLRASSEGPQQPRYRRPGSVFTCVYI